jgi:hypothetical protein
MTTPDSGLDSLRASFAETALRFPEGSAERRVAEDLAEQVTEEQVRHLIALRNHVLALLDAPAGVFTDDERDVLTAAGDRLVAVINARAGQ